MDSLEAGFPYKRIVVTGGAGFLGRFDVERLQSYPGVGITVPRSGDYDLVKEDNVKRLLADANPDLVIHLAAVVGGIGHNQKNPGRFFYDNLMMGTQLIEQSRLHGVRKFVAIGTVCAYPKFTPTPFKEDDIWNGYPEETNAPYGLGDNFDLETSHVIPALIRKCVEARENGSEFIEAWGSGQVSREFLYVEDCAEGVLRASALYNEAEPVNLGSGNEVM